MIMAVKKKIRIFFSSRRKQNKRVMRSLQLFYLIKVRKSLLTTATIHHPYMKFKYDQKLVCGICQQSRCSLTRDMMLYTF